MVFVLFSCLMCSTVFCEEIVGTKTVSFSELGIIDEAEYEISLTPLRDSYFYSYTGSVSDVNYSRQLSGNSLAVYEVLKNLETNTKSLTIYLSTPVTFNTSTVSPTEDEMKSTYDTITRFTQMAVDAYSRDFPENFWLDIDSSYYSFRYYGTAVNGGYTWEITSLTYAPAIKSDYSASISGHEYKFNKAVSNFRVSGSTTYDKLKSIYTSICNSVVYKIDKYCYDAYGPLVSGYGVCAGYAKAFKMLCDRENIPCVLVTGISYDGNGNKASHMWNMVKMDDSKWYYVDVTWGDSIKINYDYFLTGTGVKISALNNKTFGETHIALGDFSETGYFDFKYPTVSKTAYDTSWTAPTPTPIPTATPVPVENPEMGDANRDGKINAEDALIVLRLAAKMLDNSKGYYDYGDMQNDGVFNAEDALLILKISAKIS